MLYIHRKEHFNAAHKLYNPNWSEERNIEVFGPCANKNWHGHNFELITSVKGTVDNTTGFVIDLKILSDVINREIIEKVDHKNINLDVPFMKDKIGSCENLIIEFWKILQPIIPTISSSSSLARLRLYETPRNFVDYFGD